MNMKLHHIAAALIALAASAAQATGGGGGGQPTGDCNNNPGPTCNQYGGNGTAVSDAEARAAANSLAQGGNAGVDFWAGLSNQQRQALMSNQTFRAALSLDSNQQLNSALSNYSPSSATAYGGEGGQGGMAQARQALMAALSNNSYSTSNAAGGSGVGTVTVDGRVYYPSIPVASAATSASTTIIPGGGITVVRSGCVGRVDITDKRILEATRGTLIGLFTWGYANGFEQQVRAKTGVDAKLTYSEWKVIGYDDKGRMVQEQLVEGYDYIIFAYTGSAGAANGITFNETNRATGANGNQANTSFGTNVMEFSCSRKDHRVLMTPPAPPAPPAATPVAEKVWTLSYQVEQFRVVSVKGGKRDARPAYVAKDYKRREALPPITVTCEGKGDKPAACPGKPAPGTVIDLTGK